MCSRKRIKTEYITGSPSFPSFPSNSLFIGNTGWRAGEKHYSHPLPPPPMWQHGNGQSLLPLSLTVFSGFPKQACHFPPVSWWFRLFCISGIIVLPTWDERPITVRRTSYLGRTIVLSWWDDGGKSMKNPNRLKEKEKYRYRLNSMKYPVGVTVKRWRRWRGRSRFFVHFSTAD